MAKRNVLFTKPDEPAFLKRMKKEVGYKEEYNIDTKRELPTGPEDLPDTECEEPQIIVLAPGDLTKEEAEVEKAKKLKEENEKPANLEERIIFKAKKKENSDEKPLKKSNSASRKKPMLLSFEDEDCDEDE